jgi:hypothetical protein
MMRIEVTLAAVLSMASLALAAESPAPPAAAGKPTTVVAPVSPVAPTSNPAPAVNPATAADIEPAVTTSSAAERKPAVSNSRSTGRAMDRVELDNTQITGNRELPKVMYVVPWKKPDLGDFSGRPAKSLLDELLAPVDRDVFKRQVRYFEALRPDTAVAAPQATTGGNENSGATAPRAGDEK